MNVKPYQPLVKLPFERANILLVDDRPENLLALEAVLDDLGTNFVKANSGEEAFRRLLENEFAIVLLDIQMQGMDGFETARLIRTRAKNRHTPIIFLTAYDTEPDQLKRVLARCRGFSHEAVHPVHFESEAGGTCASLSRRDCRRRG